MERRVSHYRLLARLGGGGMGDVYRAVDDRLGREVAIKLLPPERAENPERQLRLLREAKAAGALNHPSIVTVHDVGIDAGQPYLVMELVDGRRFTELVAERIEPRQALRLCAEVADALGFAHRRGILHRDVKSDNLMLSADGRVKVLDFGLAKRLVDATEDPAPAGLAPDVEESLDRSHDPHAETIAADSSDPARSSDSDLTRHGDLLGTPDYMSPEQARGGAATPRSEVFSLGVVVYELLVGRRPFTGKTIRQTLERVRRAEVARPQAAGRPVPRGVDELLARALARDPEARFPDMESMAAALRRVAAPSRRVPIAVGGGAAVAAIASGVWFFGGWTGGGAGKSLRVADVRRLTHQPGCEENPSYSADGKLIVYDAANGLAYNLYALAPATGATRQLTTGSGWDFAGAVSPDGKQVAFLRREGGPTEVHVVSMDGESTERPSWRAAVGPRYYGSLRPAWSRDGKAVWVGERDALVRIEVGTRVEQARRRVPAGFAAIKVVELWDGRLAVVVVKVTPELAGPADGVGLIDRDGGEMRWLWRAPVDEALAVEPGGAGLLVTRVVEAGRHELWRVPLDGSPPAPVPGPPVDAIQGFAFSPAARELAFSGCQSRRTPVTALGDQAAGTARLFPWVGGEWDDHGIAPIAGSSDVLLISDRSGAAELWQVTPSGETPPRRFPLDLRPEAIALSVDGAWLAVADDAAIWVMARDGSRPARKLIAAPAPRHLAFSADGRTLFFSSHGPEGRRAAWVSLDGGVATPVAGGLAVIAAPSPTSGAIVWLGRGKTGLVHEDGGVRRVLLEVTDDDGVLGLAFHPAGERLAVVTIEDAREIDVRDGTLLRRIPSGGDSFLGAAYAAGELALDRSSYAGDLWVARLE